MPGRKYPAAGGVYRYGFNGQEKDNSTGEGNLDFSNRVYDSRIGRFLSTDPREKEMPWQSSYQFASNSPIFRLDPDGKWDIEIHSFSNRGKMSYAIAILKNKNGEEIARYVVRVAGSAGVGRTNSSSTSRTIPNGDTPQGTYDIDDISPWWTNKKSEQAAYGTSSRLAMTGVEGEIMKGSTERKNTIRMHAGRQEINNVKDFDPKNKLKFTNGCIRMYQADLDAMKSTTINLQKTDSGEVPGFTTVKDDLVESNGSYYTPSDFKNLTTAQNMLTKTKAFSEVLGSVGLGDIGKALENTAQQGVKDAESKGIKPSDNQNK